MQRGNCANWATLDSCTISASYEVSEAQKALLLPRTEKGSEEHLHICRIQLTMMSSKSTREHPNDTDAWKRTNESTLSGLWELDIHPSILTTALFHTSFHLSFDYVTVSLLDCPKLVRNLGAPGWGEPWFPQYFLDGGYHYISRPVVLLLTVPILWMMQSHYLINCADGPFSSCRCFFVWLFWLFFGLFFFGLSLFLFRLLLFLFRLLF